MTTKTTHLNNVNLEAFGALVGDIQEKPDKADTMWKAEVTWNGGFASETRIRDIGSSPVGHTLLRPIPVDIKLA